MDDQPEDRPAPDTTEYVWVRAKEPGYYGSLRAVGDRFKVDENQFSDKWMVLIDEPGPDEQVVRKHASGEIQERRVVEPAPSANTPGNHPGNDEQDRVRDDRDDPNRVDPEEK